MENRNKILFGVNELCVFDHALVSGDEDKNGLVSPYSFDSIRAGCFYYEKIGFVVGFRFLQKDLLKLTDSFNPVEIMNDIKTVTWSFSRGGTYQTPFAEVLSLMNIGMEDGLAVLAESILSGALLFRFKTNFATPSFLSFQNEGKNVCFDLEKFSKALGIKKVYNTDLCFDDINLYGLMRLQSDKKYYLKEISVMTSLFGRYFAGYQMAAYSLIHDIHKSKLRKENPEKKLLTV